MKKLLYPLILMLIFIGCGREDYSALTERLDDIEGRVAALEELCNRMNNDLLSLQTVVSAFQQNDLITGVTPVKEGDTVIGYVIEFSKSPAVTIYHGKDGEDGRIPQIGVREDTDGNCYWTIGGEWLTDSEGRRIKAGAKDGKDGTTPQLKVEDGYWHVSYDNGASWVQLGKADSESGDAAPVFTGVMEFEDRVEFTLTDGTVITIAKLQPLSIVFLPTGDIAAFPNRTYRIDYTLTGSDDETIVKALAQDGLNAAVHVTDNRSGYIEITTPGSRVSGEVLVFVSDGRMRTLLRTIIVTEGKVIIDSEYYPVGAEGGTVSVPVSTNVDYSVEIPEDSRPWITYSETRAAMRDEMLVFSVSPNEHPESRTGEINIISGGTNMETIHIYQSAKSTSFPLRLIADKQRIEPGDKVTFTVVLEGYNITSKARILNLATGAYLQGNTYSADTDGTVDFVAEYDGMTSCKVQVSTRDFFKRVLLFNFYGTWCVPSYLMQVTVARFRETYPDLLDEVTVHIHDKLSAANSKDFLDALHVNATPSTTLDMQSCITGAMVYEPFSWEVLRQAAEYAHAGLAVTTELKDKELVVTVQAAAATQGEYFLGVILIENGLTAPQAGTGSEDYIHNNVFRKNLSPIPGESLGFFGRNEQKTTVYSSDITGYKSENCEIVCYLYTREGEGLRAVNSTRCAVGESVGYRFVD